MHWCSGLKRHASRRLSHAHSSQVPRCQTCDYMAGWQRVLGSYSMVYQSQCGQDHKSHLKLVLSPGLRPAMQIITTQLLRDTEATYLNDVIFTQKYILCLEEYAVRFHEIILDFNLPWGLDVEYSDHADTAVQEQSEQTTQQLGSLGERNCHKSLIASADLPLHNSPSQYVALHHHLEMIPCKKQCWDGVDGIATLPFKSAW